MAQLNSDNTGLWAQQDKDAFLDYSIDWTDWLALSPGDTINTSTWSTDASLTLNSPGVVGSVASVWVQGGTAWTWYAITNTVVSNQGQRDQRTIRMQIVDEGAPAQSALFPNRGLAIAKLRRDRLMMAAAGSMPTVQVSDDYLWDKLRAAESQMAHELRVPLVPTAFFPEDPTDAEIAALNGMPWAIDPGYDYQPSDFSFNDKWGMIKLRNKPLHTVSRVRFAYPGGPTAHYDLPIDWVRADKKYGTVQFVPSSTAFAAPLNAFVMQAIGNGRSIPLAMQISYVAGLKDVPSNYPELLDAIYKTAALKIVEDSFLPQSGSISADGLSQSVSNDMAAHHDTVDRILHGGKGSNGGLMAAIHGIRIGVM